MNERLLREALDGDGDAWREAMRDAVRHSDYKTRALLLEQRRVNLADHILIAGKDAKEIRSDLHYGEVTHPASMQLDELNLGLAIWNHEVLWSFAHDLAEVVSASALAPADPQRHKMILRSRALGPHPSASAMQLLRDHIGALDQQPTPKEAAWRAVKAAVIGDGEVAWPSGRIHVMHWAAEARWFMDDLEIRDQAQRMVEYMTGLRQPQTGPSEVP